MRASIIRESTNSKLNNSKLIRGDTERIIIRVVGQSLVLANYGFTFTAKIDPNDADGEAIIQKTFANSGITASLVAPNLLEAVITILPDDTSSLVDGDELFYDIQMSTSSPASTRTLEMGKFQIKGDITLTSPSPLYD
jgi:hypothetical protein